MKPRKVIDQFRQPRMGGVVDQDEQIGSVLISSLWRPTCDLQSIFSLLNVHIFSIDFRDALVLLQAPEP